MAALSATPVSADVSSSPAASPASRSSHAQFLSAPLVRVLLVLLGGTSLLSWLPWLHVRAFGLSQLQEQWHWSCAALSSALALPAAVATLWPLSRALTWAALLLSLSLLLSSFSQTRLRRSYGIPTLIHATARSPLRLVCVALAYVFASVLEHSTLSDVAHAYSLQGELSCSSVLSLVTTLKALVWALQGALVGVLVARVCLLQLQSTFPNSPLLSPKKSPRTPIRDLLITAETHLEDEAESELDDVTSPVKSILRSAQKPESVRPPKTLSKTVSFRKAVNRKNIPAFEPGSRNTVPRRVIDFDAIDEDDDDGY